MAVKGIDIFGKDSLLMYSFQYYFLAAFIYVAVLWPASVHPWLILWFVYGALPALDELFAHDWRNPSQSERQELQRRNPWFLASLYLALVLDWIALFRMLRYFSELEFKASELLYNAAYLYCFVLLGAVSFLIAHQIFHKQGFFNKALGTLDMAKVLYMHFTIEHLYGHHKNVATPLDPASAEKGISLYQFVPRSIKYSWLSAYNIEKAAGKPVYLNGAVLSIASSVMFVAAVWAAYGTQAMLAFLVYAVGSICYLENINYIEHYGLRRDKLQNGEFEKVTIRHSWNAPHRFTNYILFKLQRHSDHHENSLKPYQTLLSLDDSPNLPHGYSVMLLISFFPRLWFSIMDPLVDEYELKKRGRVDVKATKRAEQLSRNFVWKSATVTSLLAILL